MHVIFVNYHRFVDSSGIHIHFLANEFEKMGIGCTVCIPEAQEEDREVFGPAAYRLVCFDEIQDLPFPRRLKMKLGNPVIHAWTPRENVRRFTVDLARQLYTPYFVHLEDNEERILATELKMSYANIARLPEEELPPWLPLNIIHPGKYEDFLKGAIGVSCIFETLEGFVPEGVPRMTFWPACEPAFFNIPLIPNPVIRQSLGLDENDFVIAYTGNMHKSNAVEITSLYQAVGRLNDTGNPVKLLRTGSNTCEFSADVSEIQNEYVHEMGSIPAADPHYYISAADILVQPGASNDFNDYRFPSKLPMFLASGRPVILPPANIGKHLKDGEECLHLRDDSVDELVDKISRLHHDRELGIRIGRGGRAFAKKYFNWERSAIQLLAFYKRARRIARRKLIKKILTLGLSGNK